MLTLKAEDRPNTTKSLHEYQQDQYQIERIPTPILQSWSMLQQEIEITCLVAGALTVLLVCPRAFA